MLDRTTMAYTTTFDSKYLDILRPLMVDLPWAHAVACYEDVSHARTLRNLSVLARDNTPCANKAFLRIIMYLRDNETHDVFRCVRVDRWHSCRCVPSSRCECL